MGLKNYDVSSYDAVIGHNIGGLIGIQLNSKVEIPINKIICIDTNFKPAEKFYRNLMTPGNMRLYGENVLKMLKSEMSFYHEDIISSVQEKFDFTQIIKKSPYVIDVLYGDRQNPTYRNRIEDLNLDQLTFEKLNLHFIRNSCHMIMIENPRELSDKIKEIIYI